MSKYLSHTKKDNLTKIEECHLRNLGLTSTSQINDWFKKSAAEGYWIKNSKEVVQKLLEFKDKVVWIFGDYDADGITGVSIYKRGLQWAGFKDVQYRIPKRVEGFGLNNAMVDEAKQYLDKKGLTTADSVILTVDNGTAAVKPVKYAKDLGFTVLVTDHHDPYEEILPDGNKKVVYPEADILINPSAVPNSSEFDGYCGAGVAFKVVSELLKDDKNKLSLLRPLAMVGTFCDVMDLKEENYVISYYGLKTLNEHLEYNIPAFKAMAKTLGIAHWNGTSVGFSFGPCINALERIEDGAAKIGVELLTSDDYEECLRLSETLLSYNERRKILSEESLAQLEAEIAEMPNGPGYPIVVYLPGALPGLVGILAGKLQEKYNAPAGVFGEGPNGTVKGSFRSPENFNIKEHLDMVQDYFEHVGGHAGAAGAGLKKENFDAMVAALQATVPHVEKVEESSNYEYDLEIPNHLIEKAIEKNELFQPIGKGNEDLKFKVTGFKILPIKNGYYGTTKKDGVRFRSEHSSAIGYDMGKLAQDITGPCTLTLYGSISYNYWVKNDGSVQITPQIIYDDFEIEDDSLVRSPMAQMLANKAKAR